MRLPRTAAELIRTSAHRCAPSLPFVAMVAYFISFLRYFYSYVIFISAYAVSLQFIRAPTQIHTAIRCYIGTYSSPQAVYGSLRSYSVSYISAYTTIV